jgi:hypothetical protein
MTIEAVQAAQSAATARWDAMTLDEKAAVKKAIAKKRVADLTAVETVAADEGPIYSRRCTVYYDGALLQRPTARR